MKKLLAVAAIALALVGCAKEVPAPETTTLVDGVVTIETEKVMCLDMHYDANKNDAGVVNPSELNGACGASKIEIQAYLVGEYQEV